ncbi:MAG: hypothetical protein ABSB99_09915 [Acidimicrobiales bacterium]
MPRTPSNASTWSFANVKLSAKMGYSRSQAPPLSCSDATQLRRSDRLGGLIHEYELAA